MKPIALTIAGSDPSGGAGIQADLKTFHQHGVYGMSVITLLTVQNTVGVQDVWVLEPDKVLRQLDAVLADIEPGAAKSGALGNAAVVRALAQRAAEFKFPFVVDPVMISKHGMHLMDQAAVQVLKTELLPHVFLVTPNLYEAEILAGMPVPNLESVEEAARKIHALGPKAVLIKGGHLENEEACDVLFYHNKCLTFCAPKILTEQTHGTGCTYSAAITAELAKGIALEEAVRKAKQFISAAIATAPGIGRGKGPVNHHA